MPRKNDTYLELSLRPLDDLMSATDGETVFFRYLHKDCLWFIRHGAQLLQRGAIVMIRLEKNVAASPETW